MLDMWEIWLAGAVLLFALALCLHERSVKKRFRRAFDELRENRELDAKIFRLYQDIEGMLDSFEEYVGEAHSEMESRRTELLSLSRQATTLYMQVMQPDAYPPPSREREEPREPSPANAPASKKPREENAPAAEKPQKNDRSKLSARDRAELEKKTGKEQKIRFLINRGLDIIEIARELNIGKGEVRLILDLDKG